MKDFFIKYWLELFLSTICTAVIACYRMLASRVKKEVDEQLLLKEGVLALLHDRLYQGCKHYISQGVIDIEGLDNMGYLYNSYHALGGNGTGTELYNRVKKLPIKEKKL